MKLIRWLLSNVLLIVIVLVLSYLYVYWDRLTDEDTPAGPAIAWLSGEFKFVGDLVEKLESSRTEKSAAVASTGGDVNVSDEAAASQTASAQVMPPVIEPSATEDKFVTPEIVASLTRLTPEPETTEADSAVTVVEVSAPVKVEEAGPATTRELWIAARRSFHRRDYENSIKNYENLIAATQDNYDARGELGNVYFNQGRIKEAAASYYEAAAVLVRIGQVDRAASLIGLLGRMDAEKALELQELITSARS